MNQRNVVLAPEAKGDLLHLYNWIADATSAPTALGYIERLEAFCNRLDFAAERGHRRDDIRPGLRIIGFERRIALAFTVDATTVTILRVFYGGQNWEDALG